MNEQIEKVVAGAQALAEKKTWLANWYSELMARINKKIKNIQYMDEDCIEYVIKEWSVETTRASVVHKKITLDLILRYEHAVLQLHRNTCEDWGYHKESWNVKEIENPKTSTIRLVASKLADAFAFYQAELERRNLDNQAAIDTISGIITRLQT